MDCAMMLHLVIVECNPEMKFGIQVLWDEIPNSKSVMFDNGVSKIMEQKASTTILIADQVETHDDSMKENVNDLLMVPSTEFYQHLGFETMGCQRGTIVCTCEDLAEVAKTIFNDVVTTGAWDEAEPKDSHFMALSTQLEEFFKSISPNLVRVPHAYKMPA